MGFTRQKTELSWLMVGSIITVVLSIAGDSDSLTIPPHNLIMSPILSDYQMLSVVFNGRPPIDEELANRLFCLFPAEEVIIFASDVADNVENYLLSVIKTVDESGTISYGCALSLADSYGLMDRFLSDYGVAGDREDPEDGTPIGIDLGELLVYMREKGADL